jgi:two-component system KDP operon response regulator KdpE
LLIEDDAWIRTFLRDALTDEDFIVLEAADGRTGLGLAAKASPDVVLLDLAMPDCNGIDVLRELSRGHRTRSVPVLILSAYTPLLATPETPPVAGVIPKPVDLTMLLRAVRQAVQLAGPIRP